jgi:hypothetical protein
MSKSASSSENIAISFTGHDTFPLRHGWLEKAYHAIDLKGKNPFTADDAIVKFGVGKNMVNAIKHWALATNFIEKCDNGYKNSKYAQHLLEGDIDPFIENIGTIWKIHYELCKKSTNTTPYWIFSYLNNPTFSREYLELKLQEFAVENGKSEPAIKTLRTDINVALAMYCRTQSKVEFKEEDISSPLAELNLIRRTDDNRYILNTGIKKTLPQNLFIASIVEFWETQNQSIGFKSNSIRVDSLLYGSLTPGRIFVLSENELTDRLHDLHLQTDGALQLSETAGILQIFKNSEKYNAQKLLSNWAVR